AIKRFGLPCGPVPLTLLIADDLHRHDDTIAAELVGGGDAVVEFSIRTNRELYGTSQMIVDEHLQFVLARIGFEEMCGANLAGQRAGPFGSPVPAKYVREITSDARPLRPLRHRVID